MSYREKPEHWILIDALAPVILQNVEGCIVDIGIGASTTVLAKHAVTFGRKQYSCDQNRRFCKWADRELRTPIVFCGDSTAFIKELSESIALAFHDGSHQHHIVINEARLLLEKLSPGGVLFIHDTYPHPDFVTEDGSKCGDLYKTRQELEQDISLQVFTWIYTAFNFGLTMVMKKETNQPECRS